MKGKGTRKSRHKVMTTVFAIIIEGLQSREAKKKLVGIIKAKKLGDDCHILNSVLLLRSELDIDEIMKQLDPILTQRGVSVIVAPLAGKWYGNVTAKSDDDCYNW